VTDSVADRDKREPFTADQLNTLFRSGPWSCPEKRTEGDPLRYWGPLVALYQGMRRGEIAQLLVNDNEVLEGVPVIHIRPSDEKRVKSLAGRRVLPVHPELIQMGYLLFVAEQRRAGHTQLFPNEKPTTAGHWGDLLGKWFAGHLKATNITGTKLGMHSFRHNFEDALRACDLHGTPMGSELAGRAKADKVSAGYGWGRYPISKLKPAMDGIGYPEVDLKHLYVKRP
jgi:integrase